MPLTCPILPPNYDRRQAPLTERLLETIFYRSSNGDLCYLREEPGADRLSIRHQPNRASGGRPAIVEVSDFLAEGHGPQHEALLRLLEDRAGASLPALPDKDK
jgi:hypothetical protein